MQVSVSAFNFGKAGMYTVSSGTACVLKAETAEQSVCPQ